MQKGVDVYQKITDDIIAELEKGALPWFKPWQGDGKSNFNFALPVNATTDKNYRGVNIVILWGAAEDRGHQSPRWLTFKQAKGAGGHVMPGQKGINLVRFQPVSKTDIDDTGKEVDASYLMSKVFTVFNVEQCEGLPVEIVGELPAAPTLTPDTVKAVTLDASLVTWRSATGADIRHGENRACFQPKFDRILMPDHDKFDAESSYWATLFHEIGHWTGADKRLKRGVDDAFGSDGYAFEELVAELASAFLCAKLGVVGEQRHAGYIESWLKALKNDKRYVVKAASAAMKAVDYLEANTVTVSEKICEAA